MTPIARGSWLLYTSYILLYTAVQSEFPYLTAKSELMQNKRSFPTITCPFMVLRQLTFRSEGGNPSNGSMSKTKSYGYGVKKDWVFHLNNPLYIAIEKGVPEDRQKVYRTLTLKVPGTSPW